VNRKKENAACKKPKSFNSALSIKSVTVEVDSNLKLIEILL